MNHELRRLSIALCCAGALWIPSDLHAHDVASIDDVDAVFDAYIDTTNSFRAFTDRYTDVENALDVYLFASPLDSYRLGPEITDGDPITTRLFDYNFFYQLTPIEWLSLYSYANGLLFAEEFGEYVRGYARTSLVSAIRLNTEIGRFHYGVVNEIPFQEVDAPLEEGSTAAIYAMGYLAVLAPVTIAADVLDSGLRLDMVHADFDRARVFSLISRSDLYSSNLLLFRMVEEYDYALDLLLQYAHTAEDYVAGGATATIGDEDARLEITPVLDLVSYFKEVHFRFVSERFDAHLQFAANEWAEPRVGTSAEFRPNRVLAVGISFNDSYFTGFRNVAGFSVYGRFHYDSSIYSLEW